MNVRVMSDVYPSTKQPSSTIRMVPSRMVCTCRDPCGDAVKVPMFRLASPASPTFSYAAPTSRCTSVVVIPSRSDRYTASYTASVAAPATRMHSISCASLIIRQPAVTGVAITNLSCGPACARLLEKTNFMFSSRPTRPVAIPRSRSPRTRSAKGLSSSCQVSTSASDPNGPALSSSCARAFSNAGQIRNAFAFAGITSAHSRSPPFRLMFAKYSELVELFASTMASM
jgi:hypothetical protein